MESRFLYRECLNKYCLDMDLLEKYNFHVTDVIPLRKVFILVTNKGNMILKRSSYSTEDLDFINYSLNYLKSNGFNNTLRFVLNKEGHILTKWHDESYVVMDLIDGRECDYSNILDVQTAVKTLSHMHSASKNISFSRESKRFGGYKLIEEYGYKLKDLEKLKVRALEYENKNEFHQVFLQYVDHFIAKMQEGIEIIKASPYLEFCDNDENYFLCHHDLAYHNVLIKDGDGYLIDFDYSLIDLRIKDLCNFINKVTKYSCYDYNVLETILDEYNKENPLLKDEYKILYGMLVFPDEFYSVAKDYFYRKKLWSFETYMYKLEKKVQDIDERDEMITTFKKQHVIF